MGQNRSIGITNRLQGGYPILPQPPLSGNPFSSRERAWTTKDMEDFKGVLTGLTGFTG